MTTVLATAPAPTTAPEAPVAAGSPAYAYGSKPSEQQLAAWVTAFHRDGYVFIPELLPRTLCDQLRQDLDRISPSTGGPTECATRLFENSPANLDLFECEPIVTLAEKLLGEDSNYGAETAHVVHNNSFRTQKGGGWSHWHHDDSPHFLCTDDHPPTNIHLPVLLMTANFYLTDQETAAHGPGQVIPGSHRFGKVPPTSLEGTRWADRVTTCAGRAGSVMVFNSQVWHRGAPNTSDTVRYVTQISYGRHSIGHFFAPFMGYQMPAHCQAWATTPRRRRLIGYMPNGPYG